MNKRKSVRLAGFVGAVGVSAALVAAASSGTGAYFTDSATGHVAGTSGHLKITTQDTSVDFTGLMPGVDQSKTIKYAATSNSTANEDVWIVFDTASCAYGAFTGSNNISYSKNCGGKSAWTSGGLGRFGHFAVSSDQGMGFQSYNLAFNGSGTDAGSDSCNVNADTGNGGSGDSSADNLYCGVPGAIKIASNIQPGAWHSAKVTFGLTGKAQAQDITWANVPFTVTATQVGVSPKA